MLQRKDAGLGIPIQSVLKTINQASINSNIHCSFIEQEKYTGPDKSTAKKTKGNIFGSFLCPNEVDNDECVLVGWRKKGSLDISGLVVTTLP